MHLFSVLPADSSPDQAGGRLFDRPFDRSFDKLRMNDDFTPIPRLHGGREFLGCVSRPSLLDSRLRGNDDVKTSPPSLWQAQGEQ